MSIAVVAKTAGVSQATVSRVINKRPGVSPEIVVAVRQAMGALNYQPPPPERRPGRRRHPARDNGTHAVGALAAVVLDDLYRFTPGVFLSHLRGMELEAAEHGLRIFVVHATEPNQVPVALADRRVAGLVLLGARAAPGVLRALAQYPSVWLSSHHDPGGDSILAGNHQISQLAADYLVGRGHKHLGFVAVMSSYPAYPARAEAFRFAALSRGATAETFMDEPLDVPVRFPQLSQLQRRMDGLIERLVEIHPRPTGLFVANDMMTAMAYKSLRSRGLTPGTNVEIVSCNNELSYLVGLDPRPATIDIGAEMIGRRTVEQLLRRIRKPDETRQVQIAISPVLVTPEQW